MNHNWRQKWKTAVLAALIWNIVITTLKIGVYFFTWSTAMFAEWIHSIADTMNQVLLYIGIKKSSKKADDKFSYWYWKERFFRAILSACGIFFIWAWVTLYRWIDWLFHPEEITNFWFAYTILAISFCIEFTTLSIALKSIYKKELWFLKSIKESDNASYAVILEDSIAVFSVSIAFVAILMTKLTGYAFYDSIGSIIIWIILWFVAILLINKNKNFIMWRWLDNDSKEWIIELIQADPLIIKVIDFKSEIIDIGTYIIKCEVEFNGTALMKEINSNGFLQEEYEYIQEYEDFMRFCVDYANRIPRLIWKNIDALELKIRKYDPEIKHIDIELN